MPPSSKSIPSTGRVRVLRYVIVSDNGTLINPSVVDGQIYGSAAHGISVALGEGFVYGEDGQLLTLTLLDYGKSTTLETPHIEIEHYPVPDPFTTLGQKAAGEGAAIPSPGGDCECGRGCAVAVRREGPPPAAVARARVGAVKWGRGSFLEDTRGWCPRVSSEMTPDPIYRSRKTRRALSSKILCLSAGDASSASIASSATFDVMEAAGRIERHVGREHHAIDAEELEAASKRRYRSDRDGVGIELMEILERMLLQRNRFVSGAGGREQLVVALLQASGSVRSEAAQVVRDDFDLGMAIEQPGKRQPRHRRQRCRRASRSPARCRSGSSPRPGSPVDRDREPDAAGPECQAPPRDRTAARIAGRRAARRRSRYRSGRRKTRAGRRRDRARRWPRRRRSSGRKAAAAMNRFGYRATSSAISSLARRARTSASAGPPMFSTGGLAAVRIWT